LDDFLPKLHITTSIEHTAVIGQPQLSRTADNTAATENTGEVVNFMTVL